MCIALIIKDFLTRVIHRGVWITWGVIHNETNCLWITLGVWGTYPQVIHRGVDNSRVIHIVIHRF